MINPIPPTLRTVAVADLDAGNADAFLGRAPNTEALNLVKMNAGVLIAHGLYESALFHALIATRTTARRLKRFCVAAGRPRPVQRADRR